MEWKESVYIESFSYETDEYSSKRNNFVRGHALNDLNRKLLSPIASFQWLKISH